MAEYAKKSDVWAVAYKKSQKQTQSLIRDKRRMKVTETNRQEHMQEAWDEQLKIGQRYTPQIPVENAWQRRAVAKENADLWSLFLSSRSRLLQEAIRDSVRTGTFHNVELYAYGKRDRISGSAHVPMVIHARTSLLEAASTVLRDLLATSKKQVNKIPSESYDYEYLDDSDLEDEELEDDDPPADGDSGEISDAVSDASGFDLDSHGSTSVDETRKLPPTTTLLSRSTATTNTQQHSGHSREVVWVPFGAVRTWQALVTYLYDGSISFRARDPGPPEPVSQSDLPCSAKSMYRLAKKLELAELAKICEDAILDGITPSNLMKELFNDFTWRYPIILQREVSVFKKHAQDRGIRSDLKRAFQDIALGKLPNRDVVLSALVDDMLPPMHKTVH